eukprot:scaffold17802_cov35-Tisochrysis_lutea.AAC.7
MRWDKYLSEYEKSGPRWMRRFAGVQVLWQCRRYAVMWPCGFAWALNMGEVCAGQRCASRRTQHRAQLRGRISEYPNGCTPRLALQSRSLINAAQGVLPESNRWEAPHTLAVWCTCAGMKGFGRSLCGPHHRAVTSVEPGTGGGLSPVDGRSYQYGSTLFPCRWPSPGAVQGPYWNVERRLGDQFGWVLSALVRFPSVVSARSSEPSVDRSLVESTREGGAGPSGYRRSRGGPSVDRSRID